MLQFMWIHGFSIGLEYADRQDVGFIINCDLGLFRLTWYKDLRIEEDEEEE